MTSAIENMEQLGKLVRQGVTDFSNYGTVNTVLSDDGKLILFNYRSETQWINRWNWFELVSRGLILECATGNVIARPFDKFFNFGERGRYPNGHIVEITAKWDGSMCSCFYYDGQWRTATRGAFESDQAVKAAELLQYYDFSEVPHDITVICEVIYPDNRIVVDYGDQEALVLIGARFRETGEDLWWNEWQEDQCDDWTLDVIADYTCLDIPERFAFNNPTEILEACGKIDANTEGWVVRFSDGSRWKFKGDRYLEVHKLLTTTSFKRVWEAMRDGTYDEMIAGVPDEFLDQIRTWRWEIEDIVFDIKMRVMLEFTRAPYVEEGNGEQRKAFAKWVMENYPKDKPYLFAMLDGYPAIEQMIYKKEYKSHDIGDSESDK